MPPFAAPTQPPPSAFRELQAVFRRIHRGDRVFVGTGCGEPQHLVAALVDYVEHNPRAIVDAEVIHVWSLGLAPYAGQRLCHNFRHNSFFIGDSTREAVNAGLADYTPVLLSRVPDLMRRGVVPIDVALVQASPPDEHGAMSLGISVDIVRAAIEAARTVIVQVNSEMPRVHGDSFLWLDEVDHVVAHDEPLLEFSTSSDDEVVRRIGAHVSSLIRDGDTIQVGYGSIPNAVLAGLHDKRHLGVHTELLTDGVVELMRRGVVDNSRKPRNRGKTVAAFCMGSRATYRYLHDNPAFDFRPIDYTNSPLVLAQLDGMTAINGALEIDLTGQATAESLGTRFYSGIGGQADFMRGAVLARGGKSILAMPSTAAGGRVSRIVPALQPCAATTLVRGDVQYVVTEYGIAYLCGKNIRERAMELISIAHPRFRGELIAAARERRLIYSDQAFVDGAAGACPEGLETTRTTSGGVTIRLRPVQLKDEPRLKDFFYALSDETLFRRFISTRTDMHHERLQEFVAIDYTRQMVLLATIPRGDDGQEQVVGLGQYGVLTDSHIAEIGIITRDDLQRRGVGTEVLRHLTTLARRSGIFGFTAEVLLTNAPMLRLLDRAGFDMERTEGFDAGLVCTLRLLFPEPDDASIREGGGRGEAEGLSPARGSGRARGPGPPGCPGSRPP